MWSKYCNQRVCLSVCPSTRTSQTSHLNFTKFSVRVTRGYGWVLLWWQCNKYVMYFQFCSWRSCFHIMERMGQNLRWRCVCHMAALVRHQKTCSKFARWRHRGAKSAISNCILLKIVLILIAWLNFWCNVGFLLPEVSNSRPLDVFTLWCFLWFTSYLCMIL